MKYLLLSHFYAISLESVLHVLNTAAQIVAAVVSAVALRRSSQARRVAEEATVRAREAAREQITFALRRAVRRGVVGPGEARMIMNEPCEEQGKSAPEEGATHE